MNTVKTLAAILCSVVLLPSAGNAFADDVAPNRREGMRRFKEGMTAYGHGDFEQARLSLLQAYAVVPDAPNLAWDLALAESKTHHDVEALRHFRVYLRSPTLSDKERAQTQKHIDAAMHETGHIAVTADAGATLLLDGNVVHDPLTEPLDTEPGAHVLEAHKGTRNKTVNLSPQAGETLAADLRMPDEAPGPQGPAPMATAPAGEPAAVPAAATTPDAVAGETSGASQTTRILVTSAIGVGAVTSIVLGIVFTGQASNNGSLGHSLIAPCRASGGVGPSCVQGHNAAESQATDKNVATGLYIGGGVLVAAAVASWFLLAPSESHGTGALVVPDVTPTSAGLALSGRF